METLRNYLESMFAKLQMNDEVLRAKEELLQMMEDKYNGLIEEGKSENEAVGIVIAEFGNLDELAHDLGISEFVGSSQKRDKQMISKQKIEDYINAKKTQGFRVALGVMLCTLSCIAPCFDEIGLVLWIFLIGAGVGLFTFTGIMMGKWKDMKTKDNVVDFSTKKYLEDEKERYRSTHSMHVTIGVILCVISIAPPIIFEEIFDTQGIDYYIVENIPIVLMFLMVSIGVFLIVQTSIINNTYKKLLNSLNGTNADRRDIEGYYDSKGEYVYDNKIMAVVMSVFWPTVTCVYLSISFLSFAWHITWIIWPIAAICATLINTLCRRKEK